MATRVNSTKNRVNPTESRALKKNRAFKKSRALKKNRVNPAHKEPAKNRVNPAHKEPAKNRVNPAKSCAPLKKQSFYDPSRVNSA